MFGAEPLPSGDEAGKRVRQLGEQRLAGRHRQIGARQHRFADSRQMAEALDDAVDGERRDVGVGIFQKREAGLRASHFGDGSGERARQHGAAGDGGLRRRLRRSLPGRSDRLPAASATARGSPSRSPADRWRAHGSPPAARFCDVANTSASARRTSGDGSSSSMIIAPSAAAKIVVRQIGIEIGAGQRGSGLGSFAGRRVADPLQKLTDNHCYYLTRLTTVSHIDGRRQHTARRLTKRSP